MSAFIFGVATAPDLLRLLVIPVFGWAAYRDVRTRRVPNQTWLPLAVLGIALLAFEGWTMLAQPPFVQRLFVLRVGISLLVVAPMGYLFWAFGAFGGADAKALMVLAVLVPTYPVYVLPIESTLPLVHSRLGVFSLSVLSNTVLVGLVYPFALAARNLLGGHLSPAMFVARPAPVEAVITEYGRLLEDREGFTRSGLDLDALRMYLRWRGLALPELLANPDEYRDPASIPTNPNPPGDGAIEDHHHEPASGFESERGQVAAGPTDVVERVRSEDPWGAERFLEDIEGDAYGTTPEQLREGIEALLVRERVWLSPGIPFVVPMFFGLLVAFVYGDVLFAIFRILGLA